MTNNSTSSHNFLIITYTIFIPRGTLNEVYNTYSVWQIYQQPLNKHNSYLKNSEPIDLENSMQIRLMIWMLSWTNLQVWFIKRSLAQSINVCCDFSFSLTLVDSLDTLVVLGDFSEFNRAIKLVIKDVTFDHDIVVSVFETNIRILG